jgi:hypothetical protein
MRKMIWSLQGLVAGAGLFASMFISPAEATSLTLINGWSQYPGTAVPAAVTVAGVVHLKGAITTSSSNTNNNPFVLPSAYRPSAFLDVPTDLCNANNGRLRIDPLVSDGKAYVVAESSFSDAQCFTSLDGASFALSQTNFIKLTLTNGWKNYGRDAAVQILNGVVQLEGSIWTSGTNAHAFVLPSAYRPNANVYVPIELDLTNNHIGRLVIQPTGAVTVQAEGGNFSYAAAYTSLEGVSFAQDATGFTPVTLLNGWTNAALGTRRVAVRKSNGVVQFEGAIANGTSSELFVLPSAFRPATSVYVKVDLCNSYNGRLVIQPSGAVYVQGEAGNFSKAQCFTSLDGASFHL